MLRMKLRKFSFDKALDAWSDFAIDCWLFALRTAALFVCVAIGGTLTGQMDLGDWARLPSQLEELAIFVFVTGVILALAFRFDRILAREKRQRLPPDNGGRTKPAKRVRRRQRGRRKRTGR